MKVVVMSLFFEYISMTQLPLFFSLIFFSFYKWSTLHTKYTLFYVKTKRKNFFESLVHWSRDKQPASPLIVHVLDRICLWYMHYWKP
jgi:hypothetical protein